jgi:hypothetical protein
VLIQKFFGGSICSTSRARVAISSTRRVSGVASKASFTVCAAASMVVNRYPISFLFSQNQSIPRFSCLAINLIFFTVTAPGSTILLCYTLSTTYLLHTASSLLYNGLMKNKAQIGVSAQTRAVITTAEAAMTCNPVIGSLAVHLKEIHTHASVQQERP